MVSFPFSFKKWQLLMFILSACIIAFICLALLPSILNPPSIGYGAGLPPSGSSWINTCENLSQWSRIGYNFTIDNTTLKEGSGSLKFNNTYVPSMYQAYLSSSQMPNSLSITRDPSNSDLVRKLIFYDCYAKYDAPNPNYTIYSYYIIRWVSGSFNFGFYVNDVDNMTWAEVTESHGYHYFNLTDLSGTTINGDLNWHWFELGVMYDNITNPSNPSVWFMFYVDGVNYWNEISTTYDFFLPTTFSTGAYTTTQVGQNIDYLMTRSFEQYPPDMPNYPTVSPINIGEQDILFILGLIGGMLLIVSPVYGVETFIDGDPIMAFGGTFLMLLIGAGFVLAWLFG